MTGRDVVIHRHREYNICTKLMATADDLDYFIDDSNFHGQRYKLIADAVEAIDAILDVTNDPEFEECRWDGDRIEATKTILFHEYIRKS